MDSGTARNLVSHNSIFANARGGIDLGIDLATPNDFQDVDDGPNGLQNFPVIVSSSPATTGTLNSTPNRSFVLEFFSDPASSNQQGKTFRGSTTVTTNANGDASFSLVLPGLPAGNYLVATATDTTTNDTSEFTSPLLITAPTAGPSLISGQVAAANGAPLAGVVVYLNGGQARRTITDSGGNYRFDNVGSNNFYTVTPSRVNYHFSPESRSFSLLSNETDAGFAALEDPAMTASAIDKAEFFVSPNPGEDLRPLARIVSGGELSRLMLAIRSLTGRRGSAATLIFDEVDAGIGGHAADVVGRRLQTLARDAQVLCITHLPQIAAHGDVHFQISKQVRDGRTLTRVVSLVGPARELELARMIAGEGVSDGVRASAGEMLASRRRAKDEQTAKGESESRRAKGRA